MAWFLTSNMVDAVVGRPVVGDAVVGDNVGNEVVGAIVGEDVGCMVGVDGLLVGDAVVGDDVVGDVVGLFDGAGEKLSGVAGHPPDPIH